VADGRLHRATPLEEVGHELGERDGIHDRAGQSVRPDFRAFLDDGDLDVAELAPALVVGADESGQMQRTGQRSRCSRDP